MHILYLDTLRLHCSRLNVLYWYISLSFLLDLWCRMSVRTRIRPSRPYRSPRRRIHQLLYDLPTPKHRPSETRSCPRIMSHLYIAPININNQQSKKEDKKLHSPRSFSTTSSEIPSSKYTSPLISPARPVPFASVSGLPAEMQKRGASSAAWAVKPRRILRSTCT